MKEGRFDVTDRISQLPEEILHHILSFLLVKDAFRPALLSKSWYNACRTLPSLDFGENFFPKPSIDDPTQEIIMKKTQELLNVVDHIIRSRLRQGGSLQKFWLLLPERHMPDLTCYLNRWIGYIVPIVHGNVKELAFAFGWHSGGCVNTLPEAVYAAKSLTKLYLDGFKMDSPSTGIKFSSLRELYLFRNYLDNQLLQLLLTSCPKIELLELQACYGFDILQIRGLLQLKKLNFESSFENFKKIEIHAPNLQHLLLSQFPTCTLPVFNVTACKSLKIAILNYLPISKLEDEFFSRFPLLETVELEGCERLEDLRISSNCLKRLSVRDCKNLLQVEIDAPNLSWFTYRGSISLSFSLKALALQDIKCRVMAASWSIQWQKDLTQFLGNFNHSKAMSLSFGGLDRVYVGEKVRERFHPPLYDLIHLRLPSFSFGVCCSFDYLLDSLLWIAPRLDTLSFVFCDFMANLEFIYENHKDDVECPCCRFLPINCWRCSLKRVRFERSRCPEFVECQLKEYLHENAKILASIDVL